MATDKKIPSNLIFNKEKFRYDNIQDVINDTGLTVGLVVETDGYNTLGDGFDAKYLITNVNEQGSILLKNGNYAKEISNSNGSKKLDKVNTIEELKSQNLKVGDIVEVLGYYSADDGANHKRIIKTEDDGSGVQLNNGLWANIVHNGEVNVSWFGAKGDGVTDDTIALNKSFKYETVIFVPNAIYKVKYVDISSPNTIVHGNNATISIDTNIQQGQKTNGFGNNLTRNTGNFDTIILKNINFNGNEDKFLNWEDYSASEIFFNLVCLWKYSKVVVDNCNFKNTIQDALHIWNCNDVKITKCNFKNIAMKGMIGTLNAITAFSKDENKNSILVINDNVFDTVHDSVARIDRYELVEFNNNVVKDIKFTILETSFPHCANQCLMNINNNNILNTNFFCSVGEDGRGIIDKIDVNICNNTIKGMGAFVTGIPNYHGYIFGCDKANMCKTNLVDNYIELVNGVGCIYRGRGTSANISNNEIFIKTYNNKSKDSIIAARDLVVKNNRIKSVGSEYGLIAIQEKLNGNIVDISNNIIELEKASGRLFEMPDCLFKSFNFENNNFIISNTEKDFFDLLFYNSNSAKHTKINFLNIKNNTLPIKYLGANTDILNCIITNNVLRTDTNLQNEGVTINNSIIEKNLQILPQSTVSNLSLKIEKLDSSIYLTEKMKEENVYNDYISYMDEKTLYDKQQRKLEQDRQLAYEESLKENPELTYEEFVSVQPMTLNLVEEPQPSKALQDFMKKYL